MRLTMTEGISASIKSPLRLLARRVATLHIESDGARILVVKDNDVIEWGIEPLEPGLVRDGLVVDPKAVGDHISSLLVAHRVGKRDVVAGLTGQRCVPRILDLPQMAPRLLKEAIPREMKREMPVPLEEMHLSWQVISGGNGNLRVFALGVPRDILAPQVEAMMIAGAKPRSMDIKPLALARAVGRGEAIIADMEPESIDVIIVRGGIPATIRAAGLQEEVKTTEEKTRRLGEELGRTVKFHNETHREEPLHASTPVYLTGSLAEAAASSGIVEASVGHPVEPLSPPLTYPADLPVATFMVNIGLALKAR